MYLVVRALRDALKKCSFSGFTMIGPDMHNRVKITQGLQSHPQFGCASHSLPYAQVFSEAGFLKLGEKGLLQQSCKLPFPIPFCFSK